MCGLGEFLASSDRYLSNRIVSTGFFMINYRMDLCVFLLEKLGLNVGIKAFCCKNSVLIYILGP